MTVCKDSDKETNKVMDWDMDSDEEIIDIKLNDKTKFKAEKDNCGKTAWKLTDLENPDDMLSLILVSAPISKRYGHL